MAKSGVLTQRITTVMHSGTHIDAPAHVVEGTPFLDEVPLECFFDTGVVVSIPKKKWEVITAKDLENARRKIRKGDIIIVNTGWHRYYSDSRMYFAYSPGFYKEAGEWFAEKGVKLVGTDTQALDHPLGTAIAPHGPGWLDEPFEGLAPAVVNRFIEAVRGIKAMGISLLIAESNLATAARIADRLYAIDRGEIVFEGDPQAAGASEEMMKTLRG